MDQALDPKQIVLRAPGIPSVVDYHDVIDSTNRAVLQAMETGAQHGLVIVADAQTAGRGRLGRPWESPPRKNLYFSILLKRGFSTARPSELVIVAAVSLVEALIQASGLNLKLRWPNDIFGGDRKIAGILMEFITHLPQGKGVVAGIGVNVNSDPFDLSLSIRETATSLKTLAGRPFDRADLLNKILTAIDSDLRHYDKEGLSSFIERWLAKTDLHGVRLKVDLKDETDEGFFAGLDPGGALLLDTGREGIRTILAGDVTLVRRI